MNKVKLITALTLFSGLLACGITEKKLEDKRTSEASGDDQAIKEKQVLLSSYLQDVEVTGSTSNFSGECSVEPSPIEPSEGQGCACTREIFASGIQNDCYCTGSSGAGAGDNDQIEVGSENIEGSETTIISYEGDAVDLPVAINTIGSEDARCADDVVVFESPESGENIAGGDEIFRCAKPITVVPKQVVKPTKKHRFPMPEPITCGVFDHKDLALCGLDSGDFKIRDLTNKEFKKYKELCLYLSCDLIPDIYASTKVYSEAQNDTAVSIKHKKISASWQCYQFNPFDEVNDGERPAPILVSADEGAIYSQ